MGASPEVKQVDFDQSLQDMRRLYQNEEQKTWSKSSSSRSQISIVIVIFLSLLPLAFIHSLGIKLGSNGPHACDRNEISKHMSCKDIVIYQEGQFHAKKCAEAQTALLLATLLQQSQS